MPVLLHEGIEQRRDEGFAKATGAVSLISPAAMPAVHSPLAGHLQALLTLALPAENTAYLSQ